MTLGMFMPESFEGQQQPGPGQEKALPLLVFSSAASAGPVRPDPPLRQGNAAAPAERGGGPVAVGTDVAVRLVLPRLALRALREAHPGGAPLLGGDLRHGQAPRRRGRARLVGPPRELHLREHRRRRAAAVHERRRVPRQAVKVWALQESADGGGGQLEWTLTHDKDLAAHARMLDLLHHAPSNRVPLAVAATGEGRGGGRGKKSVWFSDEDAEEVGSGDVGDGCSAGSGRWNWDDASLLDMEIGEDEVIDVGAGGAPTRFSILGCHPSKEVVFLFAGAFHVVAYHLGGGKVQYLGRVVTLGDGDRVEAAFPYRPCTVGALPSYTW